MTLGTFLRDQAAVWYEARKRSMQALHLDDNWVAYLATMEEPFPNRQEMGKDHEKPLALECSGDMQTYPPLFNELNSRVQLSRQSLRRVLTAAVTPDMYRNIWRKYGKISDADADLLNTVRDAGIEEEELVRALVAKKQIADPQKEKGKEAVPKGKAEQKVVKTQETERGPAVSTGGTGPSQNDKFAEQEILWESFKAAMKDIPEEEASKYRHNDADCRRKGTDGHKTTACFAPTTSNGTKLPQPPKTPTK